MAMTSPVAMMFDSSACRMYPKFLSKQWTKIKNKNNKSIAVFPKDACTTLDTSILLGGILIFYGWENSVQKHGSTFLFYRKIVAHFLRNK